MSKKKCQNKIQRKNKFHIFGDLRLRLILMGSNSELQTFTFRSGKLIGLFMQFYIAKPDGMKSDLRIRCGPKSDDSVDRILKSKNGIRLYSCKQVAEQREYCTAALRGTHRCTSNDRCVGPVSYTHLTLPTILLV